MTLQPPGLTALAERLAGSALLLEWQKTATAYYIGGVLIHEHPHEARRIAGILGEKGSPLRGAFINGLKDSLRAEKKPGTVLSAFLEEEHAPQTA
jgi:hypothetical protein